MSSMFKSKSVSKFTGSLYIFFILTFVLFAYNFYNVKPLYQVPYLYVLGGYFTVIVFFILYTLFNRIDVFEPLPLITLIYVMFFSISPFFDLLTNNMYFFDHHVIAGTPKATLFYVVGYISLITGYSLVKNKKNNYILFGNTQIISLQKVLWVNITIWLFGFLSSLILLVNSGQSFLYIFSFGLLGNVDLDGGQTEYSFLAMFSYTMVVPWMYLLINANSRTLKFLLTIITFAIFFIRGYRFILLIMILAPIIFYYLKKGKRPSIFTSVSTLSFLVLLIGVVGFVRGDVRSGVKVNWSQFGFNEIWYGLESNFGIYKAFYKMVEVVPEYFSYTLGSQISYTFILMIPRAFWPNKPDTPLREVLEAVLGDYAVKAGTAWPNIGEYYSEFGIIGIVVIMFILGLLAKKSFSLSDKAYANTHRIITYSILFPLYLQVIIRGYTPTLIWMMVFFVIPVIINSKIGETKKSKNIFK